MSRVKELFMEQHERLIGEYLEAHPQADWDDAYKATSGPAYDAMHDHMADMADYYRDMAKDARL